MDQHDPHSPPPSPAQQPASSSNVWKIVGCSCLGLLVIGALGMGGCFYMGMKMFKENEPYMKAVESVVMNPAAKEALGEPIKPGFMPSGSINTTGDSGEAEWAIPVSGPKGSGTVNVKATRSGGVWTYETLELSVGGEKIPLEAP